MANMKSNPETASRARIAAGGTFKWAGEILAPVIAHLISQGITDFYLALHADHPGVEAELERAFGQRANLTIVRHGNVAFRQAAITNMLLNMAREEGFDVFVPFDADEFYVPVDASRTLADVLNDWVVSGNGEQMLVPMPNFLAPRDTKYFRARTLGRMPYRVSLHEGVSQEEITVRLFTHKKSISRISDSSQARLTFITSGNHRTLRAGEQLSAYTPAQGEVVPIKICHVPFPSWNMTVNPSLAGRAKRAAGVVLTNRDESHDVDGDPVASRQLDTTQHLLEANWKEFSLTNRQIAGHGLASRHFTLEPDDTCQQILDSITEAGFDADDPWCCSIEHVRSSQSFVTRQFDNHLVFDAGVTAVHAQIGHVSALYNLLEWGTDNDDAVKSSSELPSVGRDVSRRHIPSRILAVKARNKELRQTVARLQQQLDDAQKVTPPSPRPSGWRSMFRWLRRRPPNSD